ncbi:MAG: hydrogenase expression/formation protein HypE [Deltaproteobacteria bacterium]|nr:hydrogenase expression/formation protein HypE [Deltaproteobacteria bacterium]MCW5805537.1 hydrogenase expression/formation protein HypE [Deltaproteobacteria bacterium]
MSTDRVLLGHGSGGKLTSELIEKLIVPAFANHALAELDDFAVVDTGGTRLAFTTDAYVVSPIRFPGGDIGELAVNGTINDLACAGARPLALSLALILEEGLPLDTLRAVIESIRAAAARAGVAVMTGDTKVVERGHADQVFVTTSGVGLIPPGRCLGSRFVRPGDAILISGPIGDHGVAVMARRAGLELDGVASDTAALHTLSGALLETCRDVHALRDPTRGGLAAALVEIATRRDLGIEVDESAVPVREAVRGACELLGLDPLLVANEGKLVVFVPEDSADRALAALRAHPLGAEAARIGTVTAEHPRRVELVTPVRGRRTLDLPFAEPLPRIC